MCNDKDRRPSPQPSPIRQAANRAADIGGEGAGLAAIAAIAAAADPERCMVRKCVGCTTFDLNPEECGRCYAELYGAHAPSPRPHPGPLPKG